MGGIFVSYRRSDTQGEAGRLFDDLVKPFGEQTIFMDVSAIEAGRDFRKAIEEGVTKCGVLLVVMGPEWVSAKDETGARRLDDPTDFVHIETAAALRRDIPVIPVLVRGARMPTAEQLPQDLKELAYRNCLELTHARWRSDVQLLIEALRRIVGDTGQAGTGTAPNQAAPLTQAGSPQETSGSSKLKSFAPIDPVVMQRVGRELALYIGPIADIVVRRAAARCASVEDLYLNVAQEIDSRDKRQKFLLQQVPASSSSRSQVGGGTAPTNNLSGIVSSPSPSEAKNVEATGPATTSRRSTYFLFSAASIVLLLVLGSYYVRSGRAGSPQTLPNPQETDVGEPVPAKAATPLPADIPAKKEDAKPPAESATNESRPKPPARVHLSQEASQGLLITKTLPVYPLVARQAHIKGAVVLDADISREGKVESIRTISGHPLLIPAAIDAVKQWRYKPYMQNGQAVAVDTQITVLFSLSGG